MSSARSAITKLRLARSFGVSQIGASRSVESTRGSAIRCFSDDKGRVLSEEERAKESMYIKVLLHLRLFLSLDFSLDAIRVRLCAVAYLISGDQDQSNYMEYRLGIGVRIDF